MSRSTRAVSKYALAALVVAAGVAGAAGAPKFEDTMAQRVLACTGCHGQQGRAASDGYYPRIAGKPAGYLYNQLVSFRDGQRPYRLMTLLLAPLTDDYLREIAQHFADLELSYPPPQAATADPQVLHRGETLVRQGDAQRRLAACVECHGAQLMGVQPAIPALLGLPRDYINAQLGAWRTGNRHARGADCMALIAQRLDPSDVFALSQWLAAQPVPPASRPADVAPGPTARDCLATAPGSTLPRSPP